MSLELAHINSIGLNESNYGEHLNDRFATIDKNFKTIVGTDYLKGNQGDSIHVDEFIMDPTIPHKFGLYLNDEDLSPKSLYEIVRNAILDGINELEDSENGYLNPIVTTDGEEAHWDDLLKKNNKLTIVYKLDKDTNRKVIVSSLQYTFSDARFNNLQFVSNYDAYEGLLDMSCIVCIQNTSSNGRQELSFKKLNTFPTIYYNSDVENSDNPYQGTFCWVMNGNKTEIPATGPRGKVGTASSVYVTRVNSRDGSNKCYITHVYVIDKMDDDNGVVAGGKFVTLAEFLNKDYNAGPVYDLTFDSNTFVFAIKENQSTEDFGDKVWVSPLVIEKSPSGIINYYALCDDSNCIMGHYNSNNLQKWMMSMYNSATLKGLFLPIAAADNSNGVETQSAHLIYAEDIEGTNSKTRLVISPMSNVLDPKSTAKYDGSTSMLIDYDTTIKNLTIDGEGNKLVVGNKATTELENTSIKNLTIDGEGNKLVVGNKATTELETVNVGKLIISDNTCMLSNENDEEGKYIFEITTDAAGITKGLGDPIGADDVTNDTYSVYFDKPVLFNDNIKVGMLSANSMSSSDLIVDDDINCKLLNTHNIRTENLHSEQAKFVDLIVNDKTSLCGKVDINKDSVNINSENININGLLKLLSNNDYISFHPNENLGNSKTEGSRFNDNVIEKYQPQNQTEYLKLENDPQVIVSSENVNSDHIKSDNSFYDLWKYPLNSYIFEDWSDNEENNDPKPITISGENYLTIWKAGDNTSLDNNLSKLIKTNGYLTYKVDFPYDLSLPFTVSGRNIRSEGVWGKEWVKPKLTRIKIIAQIYKSCEGKQDIAIGNPIFNQVKNCDDVLFTDLDKKIYDEDNIRKKSPNNGDTVLGIIRASLPNFTDFTLSFDNYDNIKITDEDGNTVGNTELKQYISSLKLKINYEISINRNAGKQERKSTYKCYKSLKLLGILSCTKTNSNNLSAEIINRLYDGKNSTTPLEFITTNQKNSFNSLILPNSPQTYYTSIDYKLLNGYYAKKDSSIVRSLHIFNDGIGITYGDKSGVFLATGTYSGGTTNGGVYVRDTHIRTYRLNTVSEELESRTLSLHDLLAVKGVSTRWYCGNIVGNAGLIEEYKKKADGHTPENGYIKKYNPDPNDGIYSVDNTDYVANREMYNKLWGAHNWG